MLTGHKEGSKHVGNLPVSDNTPILVLLTTKSGHHIMVILGAVQWRGAADETITYNPVLGPAFLDDINIEVAHSLLGGVATAVNRQGEVGRYKVDGIESVIQIVVEVCETLVQCGSDFGALERAGRSEDGHL